MNNNIRFILSHNSKHDLHVIHLQDDAAARNEACIAELQKEYAEATKVLKRTMNEIMRKIQEDCHKSYDNIMKQKTMLQNVPSVFVKRKMML